jgi:hypothetical protein
MALIITDPRKCRKHGIHSSIRIQHGFDYLLNPDYAEYHGILLVMRIQHGADFSDPITDPGYLLIVMEYEPGGIRVDMYFA